MSWILVIFLGAVTIATAIPNPEDDTVDTVPVAVPPLSITKVSRNEASARAARFDERKFKQDIDTKKQVSQFLTSKNVIRTLVKLIFGNDEESAATSRQILNILVSVLDMLKNTLGQKARSATTRGARAVLDDAAIASTSMLKGYVKSVLAKDPQCMQKYLCEASKDSVSEGHEIGYLIAQFAGYAASYALDAQKATPFQVSYNASRQGRSGEDCLTLYQTCNETE